MIKSISDEISSIEMNIHDLKLKKGALTQQNTYLDSIVAVLNNFSLAFDNSSSELKKRLLHSLVKEIKVNPGETTTDRTINEIILHFSSIDLEAFNKTKASKKITPEFVVTYDTVHP
jgi:hypothetical protein